MLKNSFIFLVFASLCLAKDLRSSLRLIHNEDLSSQDDSNEMRLRQEWQKNFGSIDFEIHVESQRSYTATGGAGFAGLTGLNSGLEAFDGDFDHDLNQHTLLKTRIDRLQIKKKLGSYDLQVGRQAYSLGTSRYVGVLDIVSPWPVGALDTSYKPGIDAIRLQKELSPTKTIEVLQSAANPASHKASILRYRETIGHWDREWVFGRVRERNFAGLGLEGERGRCRYFAETAFFEREPDKEVLRSGLTDFAFQNVVGVDYKKNASETFSMAFLYNDFGADSRQDLASVYFDSPYVEGWNYYPSSQYLYFGYNRKANPLVDLDLNAVLNLIDGTLFFQPTYTVSLNASEELTLYAYTGLGRDGESAEYGNIKPGLGVYYSIYF